MKLRPQYFAFLLAIAPSTLFLSGCDKVKAIFGDRPSAHMPAYNPVVVQFPDQNWTAAQRQWFYHSGQGSILMPYRWFLALEQPEIKVFGTVPKFSDPAYLGRFGFLPNDRDAENPDGLPVGFAKDTVTDPHTGETSEVVGLTCAACHTGQLNYKGKGVRIDGGSAATNLEAFQAELGYAVAFADAVPFRFDRFARGVLGDNASTEAKLQLHKELKKFLLGGLKENQMAEGGSLYAAAGGFGRTDALGRIGNYVFGTELDNANLRVANAPVKLPPLWYTGWFARVQYNYSIEQPMTRNVGESLGVRAEVNLKDPGKLYQSTVNVPNLWKMENQLAGPTAFAGLKQPTWPADVFGPIDQEKAHRGAALYTQYCQKCHLPPLNSPEIQKDQYWEPGLEGRRFLKLNVSSLDEIGTDPHEAADFAQRTAVTGALGLGTVPAAAGLNTVTVKVRDLKYDALGLTPEQRIEWNGYRPDNATASVAYRARPLGGIWATPPFLHNGSVPNLYELLLPAGQRSKLFYTGSREFDPVKVGYVATPLDGGFGYRVDQPGDPHPGNSNAGHEFSNKPGKGVIGPELTDQQRWDLIEYLKTLDTPEPASATGTAQAQPTHW
jgi:cytochrome c5